MLRAPLAVILSLLVGCSDEGSRAPICIDPGIDESCTPAYEPSFDAIYANTFKPTCARSGVSCHGPGKQAGIGFDDPDDAFNALRARAVRPGDPRCSTLVRVMTSTDGLVRMPPAFNLSAGEQCAIVRWIGAGAPR